eukprot:661639-Amphidinium_carterae.2
MHCVLQGSQSNKFEFAHFDYLQAVSNVVASRKAESYGFKNSQEVNRKRQHPTGRALLQPESLPLAHGLY